MTHSVGDYWKLRLMVQGHLWGLIETSRFCGKEKQRQSSGVYQLADSWSVVIWVIGFSRLIL